MRIEVDGHCSQDFNVNQRELSDRGEIKISVEGKCVT
jgi:hypothetical protein